MSISLALGVVEVKCEHTLEASFEISSGMDILHCECSRYMDFPRYKEMIWVLLTTVYTMRWYPDKYNLPTTDLNSVIGGLHSFDVIEEQYLCR
jgi:hypothetical protein